MYNLIEHSDNYTSRILWLFKKDKAPANNTNVEINNCTSFKYSSCFTEVTYADGVNGKATNTKIAVSLKYFSALWRSLEIALIDCKNYL